MFEFSRRCRMHLLVIGTIDGTNNRRRNILRYPLNLHAEKDLELWTEVQEYCRANKMDIKRFILEALKQHLENLGSDSLEARVSDVERRLCLLEQQIDTNEQSSKRANTPSKQLSRKRKN